MRQNITVFIFISIVTVFCLEPIEAADTLIQCQFDGNDQMAINIGYTVECEIESVGDTDTFVFHGNTNDLIRLTLTDLVAGGVNDPVVTLYDPDMIEIDSWRSYHGDPQVDFREYLLTETGTYTALVNESMDHETVNYIISLQRISPPPPEAINLCFGREYSGIISPIGDTDVFLIDGTTNDLIRLTLTDLVAGGVKDPVVTLYDPDMIEIDSWRATSGDSEEDFREFLLSKTGTYTALVNESMDHETVDYGVAVECLSSDADGCINKSCQKDCPDTDGDGVPDAWDKCLDTPAGSCVDQHGCSNCPLVPVICDLTPDATVLSPGDVLGFEASVINNTELEIRVFFGGKVSRPDGSDDSDWIFGPGPVILDPLAVQSKYFDKALPQGFSGEYTFTGYVLNKDQKGLHDCSFNFFVFDNLWNIRVNSEDFFPDSEGTWIKPWCAPDDTTCGRFQGAHEDQFQWTYTPPPTNIGKASKVVWVVTPNGNLTVEGAENHQWHAWTWIYLDADTQLSIPTGAGSYSSHAVLFVDQKFDKPYEFPVSGTLKPGLHRLDITGFGQDDSFSFDLNFDLLGHVKAMSSTKIEINSPE